MQLERIERKKIIMAGSKHRSHEVSAQMEKAIFNGKYSVGQKLPSEAVLCAEYNASRTVIREALKQLTGRGVVVTRNGSGTYVSSCSFSQLGDALRRVGATGDNATMQDIYELWAMLQAGSSRVFSKPGVPSKLQSLEQALAALHRAVSLNDADAFVRARQDFHRALLVPNGNEMIIEIQRSIEPFLARLSHVLAGNEEQRKAILANFEAIVAALRNGDCAKASELFLSGAYAGITFWQKQL